MGEWVMRRVKGKVMTMAMTARPECSVMWISSFGKWLKENSKT
jgi:hypothetical protein